MPKENHRKSKDKECKQMEKFDYDVDFEKKNADKKTKYALKETLKILNDYVETHKKDIPCQKVDKCCDKKKHEEKKQDNDDCCCECECAKCVVAAFEACDAPEIDKLLNTVYTTIPNFPFPDNGALITLATTTPTTPFRFPDFNYYVTLPCDEECGEVRLLWPLVWMIREIVQRLAGRFTGTGFVAVRLVLNVLSKKLIKDPAQLIPTMNTGGINNGPCICDSSNAAQFDYDFLFAFAPATPGATISSLITGSTVTFSAPNIATIATFAIDPVTLKLSLLLPASPELTEFLTEINDAIAALASFIGSGVIPLPIAIPTIAASLPLDPPAHYYSFIPSCEQDGCDGFWVATSLEFLHV